MLKNKPPIYSKATVKGKEGRGWGVVVITLTRRKMERERERNVTVVWREKRV